jgi:hypothetical protein
MIVDFLSTADSSSTASYTGPSPVQTDGENQTQTFDSGNVGWKCSSVAVPESVPSQVVLTCTGAGVRKIGNANQFQCTKSLAGGTFQIQGHVHTSRGTDSGPASGTFVYLSRNAHVCQIDQNGVVTPTGRGQTTLEVRYSRSCRVPQPSEQPSVTESMAIYCTCDLTVLE